MTSIRSRAIVLTLGVTAALAQYVPAADLTIELSYGADVRFVGAFQRWDMDGNHRKPVNPEAKIETPEDRYNYAVTLINRRRPTEAATQLLRALEGSEKADHIHYALAICYGLQGELTEAGEHLRRAIALDPKNRTIARNDPDFDPFVNSPPISSLLEPERTDSE